MLCSTHIIAINIDLIEKLDSNSVVSSLAEVHSVLKVAAAKVKAHCHVLRTVLQTFVVSSNVCIQQLFMINALFFHPFNHGLGAKIGKEGIVELNITYPKITVR